MTKRLVTIFICTGLALFSSVGCDQLFTEEPPPGDDFESPLPGISDELGRIFALGDENFEKVFAINQGLGPIFNQPGCESCHPGDGRGSPDQALIRFSVGANLIPELGGPQLQDKGIPGVTPEALPAGVNTSKRLPPPVFGVGFIEAIPAATIIAMADSADADSDSISGRVNWVLAADFVPLTEVGGGAGWQVGRFGRKGSVSSLLQQVSEAYHQDMGITSDFLPDENLNAQGGGISVGDNIPDPEIPANVVGETTMYVRLLAPPSRGEQTSQVKQGEQVFASTGCDGCHVPTLMTGPSPIPQLANRPVNLYSDLLLHDMGPELADNRPDGSADGSEWKTPPLWGTRLVEEFLDGNAFYMHDGRARSLDEAIRLHGGEALVIRQVYEQLNSSERESLLAFLRSL